MTREIPLTQGQVALIDDEDFDLVAQYKWYAWWNPHTKSFYATTTIRKPDGKWTTIYMHRLIMNAPKGKHVDHIFHLTLDNRKSELRLCTPSQNAHNSVKRTDNTSGFKGVCFDRRAQKWVAHIQTNGKQKHIGYYATAELANAACMESRPELHGTFMNNGEPQ
jgi:hypothetical protein